MTSWEYKRIHANGKELLEKLAEYDESGWELVSHTLYLSGYTPNEDVYSLIFRRRHRSPDGERSATAEDLKSVPF